MKFCQKFTESFPIPATMAQYHLHCWLLNLRQWSHQDKFRQRCVSCDQWSHCRWYKKELWFCQQSYKILRMWQSWLGPHSTILRVQIDTINILWLSFFNLQNHYKICAFPFFPAHPHGIGYRFLTCNFRLNGRLLSY